MFIAPIDITVLYKLITDQVIHEQKLFNFAMTSFVFSFDPNNSMRRQCQDLPIPLYKRKAQKGQVTSPKAHSRPSSDSRPSDLWPGVPRALLYGQFELYYHCIPLHVM